MKALGIAAVIGAATFAALTVAGCASTSANCPDLSVGNCTVSSSRFLTDSLVTLTTPKGLTLTFSSKPDQTGTAAAFKALGDTIGLLGALIKPAAVVAATRGPYLDENGVAHSSELTGP